MEVYSFCFWLEILWYVKKDSRNVLNALGWQVFVLMEFPLAMSISSMSAASIVDDIWSIGIFQHLIMIYIGKLSKNIWILICLIKLCFFLFLWCLYVRYFTNFIVKCKSPINYNIICVCPYYQASIYTIGNQ